MIDACKIKKCKWFGRVRRRMFGMQEKSRETHFSVSVRWVVVVGELAGTAQNELAARPSR